MSREAAGILLGDRVWVAFCARLQGSQQTSMDTATCFDGTKIGGGDWAHGKIIWGRRGLLKIAGKSTHRR